MDLQIRKMTNDDFTNLHRLLSDPQVMKFLEPPFSEDQTSAFLKIAGLSEPPLIYAVDADGEFIGYVIFHDFDESSIELGWVLYPSCWGQGYASQLTIQMMENAKELGKDLMIECAPEQAATKHIALKHGFVFEGIRDSLEVYRYRY